MINYLRDLDVLSPSVIVPEPAAKDILGFKSEEGFQENMELLGLRRVQVGKRHRGVTVGNLRDAIRRQSGLTT